MHSTAEQPAAMGRLLAVVSAAADIAPDSYHTQHARQQRAAQSGAPLGMPQGSAAGGWLRHATAAALPLNTHAHTVQAASTHSMTPNTQR